MYSVLRISITKKKNQMENHLGIHQGTCMQTPSFRIVCVGKKPTIPKVNRTHREICKESISLYCVGVLKAKCELSFHS